MLAPLFDLAVFVYVPPALRIERLKKRGAERYGARILPGGGRSLAKHGAWMQTLVCPVLRVENIRLEESAAAALRAAQEN